MVYYFPELDDPSLVTTAQPYKGQFSLDDNHTVSEKLNHAHNKYRAVLENTLAGMDCFLIIFMVYLV